MIYGEPTRHTDRWLRPVTLRFPRGLVKHELPNHCWLGESFLSVALAVFKICAIPREVPR